MPELSIIVPIYNVAEYLPKCLDSIMAQTYRDFELILVDDGSYDGSEQIIDHYASKDKRVIVIHKTNEGVSKARNTGLDRARGVFLGFVDGDDYIDKMMYESMIALMERTNSDLGICGYSLLDIWGNILYKTQEDGEAILTREEALEMFFQTSQTFLGSIWNKVYRRSVCEGIHFSEGICIGEDTLFLIQFMLLSKKVTYIMKPMYYYLQRNGSLMQNNLLKQSQGISVYYQISQMIKLKIPHLYPNAYAKYLDACIRYLDKLTNEGEKYLDEKLRIKRIIIKNMWQILRCNNIRLKLKIAYFLRATKNVG